MAANGMDMYDTDTVRNVTECLPEAEPEGMPVSEIITVAITSILGVTGIVFNIAILVITFQRRLIKKDYRMLYYMFITVGDLLFAINCLFVGINIAFKSVYVFKLFGVCVTLMLLLGVVAYEWSAICIILLIVDLVWTIRKPFSDNKRMKMFSKIGCIWTFFLGIILALGPFLYWNDTPYELPFCSIGNLYGKHLDVYQHEVVIVLSSLVAIMMVVSGVLLYQVYQSHAVSDESYETKSPNCDVISGKSYQNENGKHKREDMTKEITKENTCVISIINDPKSVKKDEAHVDGEDSDETGKDGVVNSAFVGDIGDIVHDFRKSKATKQDAKNEKKLEPDSFVNYSRREVRRREFNRACRTVAIFMAAYLGCCTPYLIWNALGLACGSSCSDNDRPETRVIRALVATALYLLPVIDPILYTRRFDVFKKASFGVMRRVCRCNKVQQTM